MTNSHQRSTKSHQRSTKSHQRSMEVEQAVFASADRGKVKGYQLVAKSPGVHREACQLLSRWAPTMMVSADPADWTINCFPVTDDFVAITRTTIGGPEYSGRGANQVVTISLLLRPDQFEAYSCNAIHVARTAMAMGLLRLPWDLSREQLPLAQLPRHSPVPPIALIQQPSEEFTEHGFTDQGFAGDDSTADVATDHVATEHQANDDDSTSHDLTADLVHWINSERRFAVIGAVNPLETLGRVIPRLAESVRRSFSFTTGLAPSARRPFDGHFLPAADPKLMRTLESQKVVAVQV